MQKRAVRLGRESGRPIAHVARDLGVRKEALRHWVRPAEAERGHALRRCYRPKGVRSCEAAHGERRTQAGERELKDASVYFAQELDLTRRR